VGSQSWSKEGTVRHCQSEETSILWSHHEETRELPGERNNARNNARCTQARKTTHGLNRRHQVVDRTLCGRVNQNDRGWRLMEKVRPWCGQPSDRGRLRNTTEQNPPPRPPEGEGCEVLRSACLSVCSLAHLKNMSKHHEIFCTRYLWPWLGPPGVTIRYVM